MIKKLIVFIALFSCLGFAQSTCGNLCTFEATTTTSGTVLMLPSNKGLQPTFEYYFEGNTNTSTVLSGCMATGNNLSVCDTIDTYTTNANSIRSDNNFTNKVYASYDYFKVTSTFSGTGTFHVKMNSINTTTR